jgi:hypothetical protein
MKTNVARIRQSVSLHHAMHNATYMVIAMMHAITSSTITIAIMTTNINWQSALA